MGPRSCASYLAAEEEPSAAFSPGRRSRAAPAKIGQKLFSGMKPNGKDSWAGTAFNPEDGRRYTAKLRLSGDQLVTAGCVLGGLICQSFDWTRAP